MSPADAIAAYHAMCERRGSPRTAEEAVTAVALLAPHAGDLDVIRRDFGQPSLDRRKPHAAPTRPAALPPARRVRSVVRGDWAGFR